MSECDRPDLSLGDVGSLDRAAFLRGAAAAGALLGGAAWITDIAAAARPKRGGRLRVGTAGGGAKDSIDAAQVLTYPDIARSWNLYDPIARRGSDYRLHLFLADEFVPNRKADVWTIRLRPDVVFHNGKAITPEDVIFTYLRIMDPKHPGIDATGFTAVDRHGFKKLDRRTLQIRLLSPNAELPDLIGPSLIVPVGYDPKRPVGSGPFKFKRFTPGDRSLFVRNENYWQNGRPYVDELEVIDFSDDAARVNALLGGQVDAIDQVPFAQVRALQANSSVKILISKTGSWTPFTMRIDTPPFNDVRVRQAFRLIVDRPQMIKQALAGQARVGNDLYAPLDTCFASGLPQRHQDLEQAKNLLRKAGKENLTVELVTAPAAAGFVEAAQVFAQQAKGAGVNVKVRKLDAGSYFGPNYLKYVFAQDFWGSHTFLSQAAQATLPKATLNETHWAQRAGGRRLTTPEAKWLRVVQQAIRTVDNGKRCELLREAQRIEWESGTYIVYAYNNVIDAYRSKMQGFRPSRSGFPLADYDFRGVWFS